MNNISNKRFLYVFKGFAFTTPAYLRLTIL